jgi:hypothetical protein
MGFVLTMLYSLLDGKRVKKKEDLIATNVFPS